MKSKKKTLVSIGNLVTELSRGGGSDSIEFAVRNATNINAPYEALATPAKFTQLGKNMLIETFEADADSFSQNDAQVRISKKNLRNFEIFLLKESRSRKKGNIVWGEQEGLFHTLTRQFDFDFNPFLTTDEAETVKLVFLDLVRQPVSVGKNSRDSQTHVVQFFLRWKIIISDKLFEKIIKSPAFFQMNTDDLASTFGGSKVGSTQKGYFLDTLGIIGPVCE